MNIKPWQGMAWHGMGNYMYTGNPAYSDSDIHPSSGKASQVHIASHSNQS